jgi:hypothetical protein
MSKAFDEGDPALLLARAESTRSEPWYIIYPKFYIPDLEDGVG